MELVPKVFIVILLNISFYFIEWHWPLSMSHWLSKSWHILRGWLWGGWCRLAWEPTRPSWSATPSWCSRPPRGQCKPRWLVGQPCATCKTFGCSWWPDSHPWWACSGPSISTHRCGCLLSGTPAPDWWRASRCRHDQRCYSRGCSRLIGTAAVDSKCYTARRPRSGCASGLGNRHQFGQNYSKADCLRQERFRFGSKGLVGIVEQWFEPGAESTGALYWHPRASLFGHSIWKQLILKIFEVLVLIESFRF